MDRRHFLTGLVAAFAAACSRNPELTTTDPTTTSSAAGVSADDTTTSTSTGGTPDAAAPGLDPLEAPALGVPVEFTQGVSSGDPDATSVVLWTRVDGIDADATIVWEVGTDPLLSTLVATDLVTATGAADHCVHVLATLPSDGEYWYRFRADGATSPVGRTRTMPTTDPGTFTLGVSSCQRPDRARSPLLDLASAEVDLGVWLGDFVYADATDLDGYRAAHRAMRTESHVKVAAASAPWLMLWDDHEFTDNVDRTLDEARWLAAARAWHEYMPTRLAVPSERRSIARSIDLGPLGRVVGLDTRTWRDPTPRPGTPVAEGVAAYDLGPAMETTTMLGPELDATIAELDHDGAWTVLASSVLFGGFSVNPLSAVPVVVTDTWDGYAGERRRLVDAMAAARPDTVVVSGDFHSAMSLEVRPDPFDTSGAVVATELMAPPTSSAMSETVADVAVLAASFNDHFGHLDPTNGWLRLTLGPDRVGAEFRSPVDEGEWADSATATSLVVRRGAPGLGG